MDSCSELRAKTEISSNSDSTAPPLITLDSGSSLYEGEEDDGELDEEGSDSAGSPGGNSLVIRNLDNGTDMQMFKV